MIGQANSVRPGLDLSRSSDSDTVPKCTPASAYMRVIYTTIYVVRVIYAVDRFIFNIFCVNYSAYIQGGPKKVSQKLMTITLSNLNGFSKFFSSFERELP